MCTRAPRAVVCGGSALALHELIDDILAAVHAVRGAIDAMRRGDAVAP
ncbi:hypothetical protein [Streptomyces sp. NPDC101776]